MNDPRFARLSNEEIADIWYALSGAEIRHTDRFQLLVDASLNELDRRMPDTLRAFLDERFLTLRRVDSREEASATLKTKSDDHRPG